MRQRWDVPEPLATGEVRTADGAGIILRRHGNPAGPRLVLSHGNGLAIDLYYPFWSLLMDRFDLVLYDIRSHGWNPTADIRMHNIATFVSDNKYVVRGIDRHFGEKPKIGVFHSLSALTALNHEPLGESFAALVLFDPPIYPPSGDPWSLESLGIALGLRARARRERFETREEFVASERRSPVFRYLQPGVADLGARAMLRPTADRKGYELCCPLEYEAKIYEQVTALGSAAGRGAWSVVSVLLPNGYVFGGLPGSVGKPREQWPRTAELWLWTSTPTTLIATSTTRCSGRMERRASSAGGSMRPCAGSRPRSWALFRSG